MDIEHKNLDPRSAAANRIRKQANLKAAKYILNILNIEYASAKLSGREFQKGMLEEIEGIGNSLELTKAEQEVLRLEFAYLPVSQPRAIASPKVLEPTPSAVAASPLDAKHKPLPPIPPQPLPSRADPIAFERQTALMAFKNRGREQGIRITDEMVAKVANHGRWNDRTMVTRWKGNDRRSTPIHDKKIRAVLARSPIDTWPATSK